MSVSYRINYGVLIALCIVVSTQSCTSISRQVHTLQLESNRKNPSILRLCNYGDVDVRFYQQSENLAKGHLFIDDGDEYGYYVIKYHLLEETDLANIFITAYFSPLALLGMPVSNSSYYLSAKLYIFDSQGSNVFQYDDSCIFRHFVGLYYGYGLKRKIEKKYSELYERMFDAATHDALDINSTLKKAGPINDENEKLAKANIEAFFENTDGAYKKYAVFHYESSPSYEEDDDLQNNLAPQNQEKKPLNISDFNYGLEIGKYYCTQYRNLSIQMLFGIFTLQDGNKSIAVGTYKSYGDKLVVSFYEGELKGQTYTYIIEDSKHFRFSVGSENWVHESIY